MAGLDPAIHVFTDFDATIRGCPALRPGMTKVRVGEGQSERNMTVVLATAPGYDPSIPISNIRRRFVMSIFGDIMSAIFGRSAKAETPAAGTQGPATPAGSPAAPPSAATPSAPSAPAAAPAAPVDVAAVLDALAKKNKQKLNWRKSIVDLMKLLDLDSSQAARKKLADELHYTGDTKDSAKMNVWLHKQVMIKLAANGGKVPADLKD
jgi:uncharacterized protein DUF3597